MRGRLGVSMVHRDDPALHAGHCRVSSHPAARVLTLSQPSITSAGSALGGTAGLLFLTLYVLLPYVLRTSSRASLRASLRAYSRWHGRTSSTALMAPIIKLRTALRGP